MAKLTIADVKIDAELKALLPSLTSEEKRLLREAVERDAGFTDPVVVWLENGTLIDGYNRFEIWQTDLKSDVEQAPKIVTMSFKSKDAVKAWMLHRQSGRRNLSESQRAMLASQLASLGHGQKKSDTPLGVSQPEAAKEFNASVRNTQRATVVRTEGTPSLIKAVTDGVVAVSDAAKIVDLPKRTQNAAVNAVAAGKAPTVAKAVAAKQAPQQSLDIDNATARMIALLKRGSGIAAEIKAAFVAKARACREFTTREVKYCKLADSVTESINDVTEMVESMAIQWAATKKQVDE